MKQKLLNVFLFLWMLSLQSYAQDRTVSGIVTDAGDGSPIPGVSVVVKGTKLGTQTNASGRYSIAVSAGGSLVFTSIGFTTQTVKVNGNVANVTLERDSKQLSEVVVTGYGMQKKSEVTGSISSIRGEDFADLPIQTPDKALQGRVSGVQVSSNSGQPGGGMSVNIHGIATINGSTQPLYVVDGVQVNSGGLSGQTSVNALSSINPNDIESIEILKDAASAAIYGSLAGNGVVLITTKRGKAGKTQITASAQYGIAEPYNSYELLDATQWFNLRTEAYLNNFARTGQAASAAVAAAVASTFPSGTVPTTIPSYDWYKAISQRGHIQQYDVAFNGGESKTKFYVSGSFNDTDGSYIESFFKRGTVRGNLDHQVSDKLSITSSLSLTGSSEIGPTTNAGFFTNGVFTGAIFTPPVNAIYNPDGTFNTSLVGVNSANIVQNATLEQRSVGTFQTVSNLALNYKIVPDLALKAFAGIDFSDIRDLNYRPATLPAAAASVGTGSEVFRRNINYNLSGTALYSKKIADHNFSVLGGLEYRSLGQNILSASAQGFASPLLHLVSAGSTPTATTSSFTGFKTAGLLGNVHYDYKGKYLFTGNIRYDGSSRFGANHRFGTFYGLSAGWLLTEEPFMSGLDFISTLKPRASYGVTGTQPTDNFGSLALYGVGGQYGNPGLVGGLRPTQLPNPNLTWERSATTSLGLDFGFLRNRIKGSFDIYRRKNSDLILFITLPGDSGFTGVNQNTGAAKSEGYDFELNTVNVDRKEGIRWETGFNLSFNRNKLLSLYDNKDQISTYTYTVGMPLNNIYTYKWAGVNPADGRPMYYDINNNITYSPKVTDQRIVGDQNPNFFGGLTNTVSFKGVSLDFLFQYQYGNEAFLQSQQYLETAGAVASNQVVSQLQRWTTPGQITSVPRAYFNLVEPGGYNIQNFSSRFVETASYIRLKQATLKYSLPESIVSKLKLSGLSVYVQGLNLATFTNYRGDDPENTGNNLNFYPNPRTITGGLNIKL